MAGVDGSPYVFDQFLLARVVLDDGRFADSAYVRINAYRDKLHFRDEQGNEMQSTALIREVTIIDPDPVWHDVVFRSSFEGNLGAFYQVVQDGDKIQLLKKLKAIMWETKALGMEDKRTLQLDEEYFFCVNGVMYRQDKKCSSLRLNDIFKSDKDKVLQFIYDNKINCNKIEDMKKVVEYYNSL